MSVQLESTKRLEQLVQFASEKTGVSAGSLTEAVQVLADGYCIPEYMLLGQPFTVENARVTEVAAKAFYNNVYLTAVSLPNVTQVAAGAFANCSALETVSIPLLDTVIFNEEWYLSPFSYSAITEISFPKLQTLCQSCFSNCTQLTKAYLPLVTVVSTSAFTGTSIKEFDFTNIEELQNYAFSSSRIEVVNIDHDVVIGANAFSSCNYLLSVNMPEVTSMGNFVFQSAKGAFHLKLGKLSNIPQAMCNFCTNMLSADLGNATSIAASAFANCTALETVIIRSASVCSLAAVSAFNKSAIANKTGYIYVPSDLVSQYKAATNWTTYSSQIRAIEDYPEITGGAV